MPKTLNKRLAAWDYFWQLNRSHFGVGQSQTPEQAQASETLDRLYESLNAKQVSILADLIDQVCRLEKQAR